MLAPRDPTVWVCACRRMCGLCMHADGLGADGACRATDSVLPAENIRREISSERCRRARTGRPLTYRLGTEQALWGSRFTRAPDRADALGPDRSHCQAHVIAGSRKITLLFSHSIRPSVHNPKNTPNPTREAIPLPRRARLVDAPLGLLHAAGHELLDLVRDAGLQQHPAAQRQIQGAGDEVDDAALDLRREQARDEGSVGVDHRADDCPARQSARAVPTSGGKKGRGGTSAGPDAADSVRRAPPVEHDEHVQHEAEADLMRARRPRRLQARQRRQLLHARHQLERTHGRQNRQGREEAVDDAQCVQVRCEAHGGNEAGGCGSGSVSVSVSV